MGDAVCIQSVAIYQIRRIRVGLIRMLIWLVLYQDT